MTGTHQLLVEDAVKTERHPYADVPLILLSGIGRSGTTAARRALTCHPLLDSTGQENNIIYDLLETSRRNRTMPPRRYAMRVPEERYLKLFTSLILDLLWPAPRGDRPAALLAFSNLTPDRADELKILFPDSRIVYIVRNGIEVISSRLLFETFGHMTFEDHCRVWRNAEAMARWGAPRADFFLIRHEELLDEGSAGAVFDALWPFLELARCPDCLASLIGDRRAHPTVHPDESCADSADLTKRRERWKYWSRGQRDHFEAECGQAMRAFGYGIPWRADRTAPVRPNPA